MTKSTRPSVDPELALFSDAVVPRSADVIADYADRVSRFAVPRFTDEGIALHARCLSSYPALAQALRSPEFLSDLASAAEMMAVRLARDPRTHAAAEVERYQRAIAEQLAGVAGHELQRAAREFLASALERDRENADARERAEVERLAAEHREAELRAKARAERDRIAEEASSAEAAAARAQAAADAAREAYLAQRRRRLAAELEALAAEGVTKLKVRDSARGWFARGGYSIKELLDLAPGMSADELKVFEGAISAELERQEDAAS